MLAQLIPRNKRTLQALVRRVWLLCFKDLALEENQIFFNSAQFALRELYRYLLPALGGWNKPRQWLPAQQTRSSNDCQKYQKIFGPEMERYTDIKLDYDVVIILYHPLPATGPRLAPVQ